MRILGFRWRRLFGFRWRRALGLLVFAVGVLGVAGASWRYMPAVARTPRVEAGPDVSLAIAREQAHEIGRAVRVFGYEGHGLPDTLARLGERSDVLDDAFLSHEPADPWGTAFRYRVTGDGLRGFEVRSTGPDRRFDTADDVVEAPR
jgi:hypothetical protein